MKLKELSFLKEKKLFNNYTNFEILMFSTYLKALYAGLNQHKNENGVNNIRYNIPRPNVENPPLHKSKMNPPIILSIKTQP